jgi:hypothetical protein
MLGLNTQFDLFYPLHTGIGMRADQELSQSFEEIKKLVHQFLKSEVSIEELANQHMNALFAYRMLGIHWMQDHPVQIDIDELLDKLDFIKDNPRFEVLHENLIFAISTNFRLVKTFMGESDLGFDFANLPAIPQISYSDLISLLNIFAPGSIFDKLLNLLDYSIHMEFGIIASVVIRMENLDISDAKLYALERYVAKSARKFGAIGRMLHPVKSTMPEVVEPNPDEITPEWAAEELMIAESALMDGLEDY